MNGTIICTAGNSPALRFACGYLARRGYQIVRVPAPDATHLLLPVPSFEPDGRIKGGGILENILADLPETVTVVGGNLNHPALNTYKKLDFLCQSGYLAENAAITADCALQIARTQLPVVYTNCRVLVLGWGRIGKCLAEKLRALGAHVTVAARKESDLAMLRALGYETRSIDTLGAELLRYRVIFNTAPAPVLSREQLGFCCKECLLVELASTNGMDGEHILVARGLPGKLAPESSGLLIANTLMSQLREGIQ